MRGEKTLNKTEEMKDFFNECITKDLINSEDLAINYMKVAKDYIEELERAKGIKEALELANMTVKDFVYFKHKVEELETKEQNLREKLEERKKQNNNRYGKSIDDDEFPEMYEYSGQVQEDDYILEILKGEKEC